MSASVVIVVRNQCDYSIKCVRSVLQHTPVLGQLIVVDNGSGDNTETDLLQVIERGSSPGNDSIGNEFRVKNIDVSVIRNKGNLGFPMAANQGLAISTGKFVVLLNNDTVVTRNWLNNMIRVGEQKASIGLVGPTTNFCLGAQRRRTVGYDIDTLDGINSYVDSLLLETRTETPCDFLIGFCLLIKRSVLEMLGGLDTSFFPGNFEDIDYSLRARLAGFETWIARDAYVHHYGGRSFNAEPELKKLFLGNWEKFQNKWGIAREVPLTRDFDYSCVLKDNHSNTQVYAPLPRKSETNFLSTNAH